jgi:hypothetical protein
MIRNLKALGLALAAIFALGALVAGNASAAGERFHSERERTIFTGATEAGTSDIFKAGSLEIACEKTLSGGTGIGTKLGEGNFVITEVTGHPTFFGCTDNIFGGTDTVDTTGCNTVVQSETNATNHLPFEIECTTGYSIKVTAAGCTLSFGPQKAGGGFSVKNEGAGTTRDITGTLTATLAFTKSGISCGLISATTGEYISHGTGKGFVDNGVTGPIDETEGAAPGKDVTTVYTEGAQVGIWWQ